MKKTSRNVNFRNSHGLSAHEFKLASAANSKANMEVFNDVDKELLRKLSPEEFAWYAEFMANYYQGFEVDATIVGEDNAKIMNDVESKRAGYRMKNRRQASFEVNRKAEGIYINSEANLEEKVLTDIQYL